VDVVPGVPLIGENCPYEDGVDTGKLALRNPEDRSAAMDEGRPPGESNPYGFAVEVFWYCNGRDETAEGPWRDTRSLNVEEDSDACWFGRNAGCEGWLEGSDALNGRVVVC